MKIIQSYYFTKKAASLFKARRQPTAKVMLKFYKYQGAGNDFIIFDNRERKFPLINRQQIIEKLCDRRFGIGADGVMLLEQAAGLDFKMVYFNADGNESSMCGNGGRCLVSFANELGIVVNKAKFTAIDGLHDAVFQSPHTVRLRMNDVESVLLEDDHALLDTGSPHYVKFVEDLSRINVFADGRNIRNQPEYAEKGINVNFVQKLDENLHVYTYERGVEDETLACGTGVTAAAIAWNEAFGHKNEDLVSILTKGGKLSVSFRKSGKTYTDIWLTGPALKVFEGTIEIQDFYPD